MPSQKVKAWPKAYKGVLIRRAGMPRMGEKRARMKEAKRGSFKGTGRPCKTSWGNVGLRLSGNIMLNRGIVAKCGAKRRRAKACKNKLIYDILITYD